MRIWAIHSRLTVATVLGLATLAAVSGTTAGATAPPVSPVCGGFPADVAVIVAGNGQIGIEGTAATPLDPTIPAAANTLLRGPDGTTWAQVESGDGTDQILRTPPGGTPTVAASGPVELSSTGWVGDRSAAIIIDYTDSTRPDDIDSYGAVLIDYADGEQSDIGPSGGPEYGVNSMTIGPDRLAEGAWADLGEFIGFHAFSGLTLDTGFSPTTDAEYNAPPLYQWPIVSLGTPLIDGSPSQALSWIEGPDWDETTQTITGGWSLVVADLFTGTESLRLDLGSPGVYLWHADFDGRYWVGTFADASGDPDAAESVDVPSRVLVVDATAATPTAIDAGCPIGTTVTIDRLGQPVSSLAPAVATPTTVAPPPPTAAPTPSTSPAPNCPTYTEVPDRYPVQLCQTGWAVANVQILLSEAGYSVDIDGYFGPGTERAVRQFQTDNGLEVDGLVGPDTWTALFGAPDFDPGLDVDGNGALDPWEIPQGD